MIVVVVDKLIDTLKNSIISAYGIYVRNAQKGYPLDNYKDITNAMDAIDFIEDYDVCEILQQKILEHYILTLKNAK